MEKSREVNPTRFYQLADMTIRLDADLPITDLTFHPKFKRFETSGPGCAEDTLLVRHHYVSRYPGPGGTAEPIYRSPPWTIYRNGEAYIYEGIGGSQRMHIQSLGRRLLRLGQAPKNNHGINPDASLVAVVREEHLMVDVYSRRAGLFRKGNLPTLTLFPNDEVLFARMLAARDACYFHAGGAVLDGKGILFVGHSGAGKSTIVKLLRGQGQILCDDRVIVRRQLDKFRVHGTWSHGEVPEVSADSAPLSAICLLEQAAENRLISIHQTDEVLRRILPCVIRPLETADWWDKTLTLIGKLTQEVPIYALRFDTSGAVVRVLEEM